MLAREMLGERDLVAWLERAGVLEPGSGARVERAGRGNLNFVRRVRAADGRSWVVKQAPPHVEGFPQYPLPSERIEFEQRYARVVPGLLARAEPLVPGVLHFDAQACVLVMEDLGDAESLDARLARGEAPVEALVRLGESLAEIHARSALRADALEPHFRNSGMRQLNGLQMFEAPYAEAVPGLASELEAARQALLGAAPLRARVEQLSRSYARAREALVHGDAKAPNVLVQGTRPRLIDAEFAHLGDPAFDLGVALGHLFLYTAEPRARAAFEPAWQALLRGYAGAAGRAESVERALRFAGAIAIAHVVGPSRVGFSATEHALEVVHRARELVLR